MAIVFHLECILSDDERRTKNDDERRQKVQKDVFSGHEKLTRCRRGRNGLNSGSFRIAEPAEHIYFRVETTKTNQSPIVSNATGAIVSSISRYSLGLPVLQVCS